MTWNVYNYNFNSHKIEKFNIFRHGSFTQIVKIKPALLRLSEENFYIIFGQNQNMNLS